MLIRSHSLRCLAFVLAFCDYAFCQVISTGGSNYGWYDVNLSLPEPNASECFGIIKNYHRCLYNCSDSDPTNDVTVRQIVQSQLQFMKSQSTPSSRQHRLRIPIYHQRGGRIPPGACGGTGGAAAGIGAIMDSTGGNLPLQERTNLANHLADIHTAGYAEVIVGFFPQGDTGDPLINNPLKWTTWDETAYQENWNLVYNIKLLMQASSVQYKLDLCNELLPPPDPNPNTTTVEDIMAAYVQRLWIDYNTQFTKLETLGFSAAGDNTVNPKVHERLLVGAAIYDTTSAGRPYGYDVHIFCTGSSDSEIINRYVQAFAEVDAVYNLWEQQAMESHSWYWANRTSMTLMLAPRSSR